MEPSIYSFETWVSGISASLIASFLVFAINFLFKLWENYLRNNKFKNIFGNLIDEELNLVVPSLRFRSDVEQFLANNQT